jgi:hypothetical protein
VTGQIFSLQFFAGPEDGFVKGEHGHPGLQVDLKTRCKIFQVRNITLEKRVIEFLSTFQNLTLTSSCQKNCYNGNFLPLKSSESSHSIDSILILPNLVSIS